MVVKKGDNVKVEYVGTLDDGTVFDESAKSGRPLEFKVGGGMLIKGFDEAVLGMTLGEEKTVKIPKDKAYGDPNPELQKKIPLEQLPKDKEIKPGMMLGIGLPDGKQIAGIIKEVNDKEVLVDLNHPLAGKDLNFKIKLLEICP